MDFTGKGHAGSFSKKPYLVHDRGFTFTIYFIQNQYDDSILPQAAQLQRSASPLAARPAFLPQFRLPLFVSAFSKLTLHSDSPVAHRNFALENFASSGASTICFELYNSFFFLLFNVVALLDPRPSFDAC